MTIPASWICIAISLLFFAPLPGGETTLLAQSISDVDPSQAQPAPPTTASFLPEASNQSGEVQPALNSVTAIEVDLIDREITSLKEAAKAFEEQGQRYLDKANLSDDQLEERGENRTNVDFWTEQSEAQKKGYLTRIAELEQERSGLLAQSRIAPVNVPLTAREASLRHELNAALAKYDELLYLRLKLQGYHHEYNAVMLQVPNEISNPLQISSDLKSEIPALKAKIIQLTGEHAQAKAALEDAAKTAQQIRKSPAVASNGISRSQIQNDPSSTQKSEEEKDGHKTLIIELYGPAEFGAASNRLVTLKDGGTGNERGLREIGPLPLLKDKSLRLGQSSLTDWEFHLQNLDDSLKRRDWSEINSLTLRVDNEFYSTHVLGMTKDGSVRLGCPLDVETIQRVHPYLSSLNSETKVDKTLSLSPGKKDLSGISTSAPSNPVKADEEPGVLLPYISAQFNGELRFDKLDLPPVKLVFERRGRASSPFATRTKVPVGVHSVTLTYSQEAGGQLFSIPLILEVLPEVNKHDVGPVELSFRFMLNDLDSMQRQIFGQACILYETPNTRIGANGRPAPTAKIEVIHTISDLETVRTHAGPSQSGGNRMMPNTSSEGATVAIIYSPEYNQRIPFQRRLVSVMSGFRGGGGIVTLYTPDQLPDAGVPVTIYSMNPNAKSPADLDLKVVMNEYQFDHSDAGTIYLKSKDDRGLYNIQNLAIPNTPSDTYILVPAAKHTPDIIAEKVWKQLNAAADTLSAITPIQNPAQENETQAPVIEIFRGVAPNDPIGKEVLLTDRRSSVWIQNDPFLKAEDIKSLDIKRGIHLFLIPSAMEKIKALPPVEKTTQWIIRVDEGFYPALIDEDGFIMMASRSPELLKRVERFSEELSATKKESP